MPPSSPFCLRFHVDGAAHAAVRKPPCAAAGWMQPDNSRKKHVALSAHRRRGDSLAYAASFAILCWRPAPPARNTPGLHIVGLCLPAAVVIFATGLLDDLAGLDCPRSCWVRLSRLFLACLGGVRYRACRPDASRLARRSGHRAVLVCCTNAFNLIDGNRRLASGLGRSPRRRSWWQGLLHHDAALAAPPRPLAGALFGFLALQFQSRVYFSW